MKTTIVLAMHGAPPNDFPPQDLKEFFELHGRLEGAPDLPEAPLRGRYEELAEMVRRWPRNRQNDPYHAGSHDLARALGLETGREVIVGFNEFCAPTVDEALARAAAEGADRIVVLTSMMTRGGEHAERDIAQAVERARRSFPRVQIIYAWPFETADIARFFAEHFKKFFPTSS
jgi:sirohydrochlorin cobaltochelatase